MLSVGTETVPEACGESAVKRLEKDGVESFAYLFHHYIPVHDGSKVECKLFKPTETDLPSTPKSLSNGNGSSVTLSTPPNLTVPVNPPPVLSRYAITPEKKPNRDAVKRNLAESFPSPKRQNTGAGIEATHQVSDIEHFMNRYTIKVRYIF